MTAVVAGIGCRPLCAAEEIEALLRRAEALAGCRAMRLAIPDFRAGADGPREAAGRLGLPLHLIPRVALEAGQSRCPTRSEASLRATGLASVAEAAALALAGPGGRLVLPRIASANATCALATGPA
ncbi:cobalamin biosynthesis protein [Roseomonas gilardii subsp. gilardii]|uniref:cobalamin biosynthesis protein n=1 Tax=Roseomonas gilardii TaxID=257708 RepID=UPI001FF7895F|nr:cobalamin biosynthesis protein [Roseomonas gilardii]UPG71217.1 cobalamin biosynthesis protein [Roseomonas gilardii subsp. gilardii]